MWKYRDYKSIIIGARSELTRRLKHLYNDLKPKPVIGSEFLSDILILYNKDVIEDLLYEAKLMIYSLATIIFRVLQDCWKADCNPLMIFTKSVGLTCLWRLYRSHRCNLDSTEFAGLMDKLEYSVDYGHMDTYYNIKPYNVERFAKSVIQPFINNKQIWKVWAMDPNPNPDSKEDYKSYLQWPPEEVMIDILALI